MRYLVLFVLLLSSFGIANASGGEGSVSQVDILINVGVQVINLLIFFFIFKKFLAGPIVEAVEKRKEMLNQLKNADEILEKKLKEAEEKKQALIEEGLVHKNKIIEEAKQEAESVKKTILEQAEQERENIIKKGEQEIENIKKDLENSWEDSVKKGIYTVYEKIVGEKDEAVLTKYVSNIKK